MKLVTKYEKMFTNDCGKVARDHLEIPRELRAVAFVVLSQNDSKNIHGEAHLQDGFENCVLHDGSRGGGSPESGSGPLQLRSLRCRGNATSNTTALQHP